ncbi:MAG: hypothetical protein AAF393_12355 [Pseudomonadota bacterium]
MADHKTDPAKLPWLGRQLLFLDNPKNVKLVVYGVYAVCALLILMEFAYTKHPYFGVERIFGFYGWYGFVMCALLVICAKAMRVVLMRDEDYYAPKDVESEAYPEDQLDRSTIDD